MNILDIDRLSLRYLCAEDAEFIRVLLNEPVFLQGIRDKAVRNAADACHYILTGAVASYQGFGLCLVVLRVTGAPIGSGSVFFGGRSISRDRKVKPVFMLSEEKGCPENPAKLEKFSARIWRNPVGLQALPVFLTTSLSF